MQSANAASGAGVRDSEEATDAELRQRILGRIQVCHSERFSAECPFRLLRKISHASCVSLVSGMERKTLIELLKVECECL